MPGRPILDGLSIFAGGALLLTPGLLTDVLGFMLLARPTRRWLQNRVVDRMGGRLVRQGGIYVGTAFGRGGAAEGPETGRAQRPAGREIGEADDPRSGG